MLSEIKNKLKTGIEKIVGDIDVGIHNYNLVLECSSGGEKTVKRLLQRKRYENDQLDHVLGIALREGHIGIAESLLEYKADLSIGLINGLLITTVPENLKVAKFLHDRGANFHILNHLPITQAISRKSFDVVQFLVESRADVIPRLDDRFWDHEWDRELETVKVLVELGMDITENDSALCLACERGKVDVVRYLIENKANVNLNNDRCIRMASRNDRLDVVEILLKQGANPKKLTPEYKEYFRMKKYYRKWRLIYHVKWIRRVLIPLYFSPGFPGGLEAKRDLNKLISTAGVEYGKNERNERNSKPS